MRVCVRERERESVCVEERDMKRYLGSLCKHSNMSFERVGHYCGIIPRQEINFHIDSK